jgi:hypothetical protein
MHTRDRRKVYLLEGNAQAEEADLPLSVPKKFSYSQCLYRLAEEQLQFREE